MVTSFRSAFDVAHLWAHQLQEEAHYRSNFYFQGDTIYSYSSQYPIAKVVWYKGHKMYVVNTEYCSNTTTKHCAVVEQSIPGNALTFHVSGCVSSFVKNDLPCRFDLAMQFIAKKLNEINALLYKQSRARTCDYRHDIISIVSEIAKWIDFWKLDKPSKWLTHYFLDKKHTKRCPSAYKFWEESNYDGIKSQCRINDNDTSAYICLFSLLTEIFDLSVVNYNTGQVDKLLTKFFGEDCTNQINASIKKAKIRYKRKINRQKKLAIANENKKLGEWQSSERETWYVGSEFREKYGWDTALRIEDDHIETSKGIYLSFHEGHRLWLIVKAFEQGKQFQHDLAVDLSDHKWKLDNYNNHVLFAGCHSIPFSECQRIADIMHWE